MSETESKHEFTTSRHRAEVRVAAIENIPAESEFTNYYDLMSLRHEAHNRTIHHINGTLRI